MDTMVLLYVNSDAPKPQDALVACDKGRDREWSSLLHGAPYFTQCQLRVGEQVEGAATDGGVKQIVRERQLLDLGTGKMDIGEVVSFDKSKALAQHALRNVNPVNC